MMTPQIVRTARQSSKRIWLVTIVALSMSVSAVTPLGVSLGGCFPSNDVCGVHLSVVGIGPDSVNGLSLGAINAWHLREMKGV